MNGLISYDNVDVAEALDRGEALLSGGKPSEVLFLNLDCVRLALKDEVYKSILDRADLLLPDGVGLKIASRFFGIRLKANCNGTDWTPAFLERAAAQKRSVFFLGGQPGVAEKAAETFRKTMPGLVVAGCYHGFDQDTQTVISRVNASGADVLLVGMGVPRQEKWIHENSGRLNPPMKIAVGALFDWTSKTLPRAPRVVRWMCLEWLWRIGVEPRRMFRRYILSGIPFLFFMFIKMCLGQRYLSTRRQTS